MGLAAASATGRRRGCRRCACSRRARRRSVRPVALVARAVVRTGVSHIVDLCSPGAVAWQRARRCARGARRDPRRQRLLDRSMPWRALQFSRSRRERRASRGSWASGFRSTGPVMLRVEANAPDGSSIDLLSDGKTVASGPPPVLDFVAAASQPSIASKLHVPGAPGTPPIPWVVSNPIYVGSAPGSDTSSRPDSISETRRRLRKWSGY